MTTFRRPIVHRCDANPDPERFVVRYNDFGVYVTDIPGVTMKGCPFCWVSYFDLRRHRFKRYCARAFTAKPAEVVPPIIDIVLRLERPGFPENGICNHFGPYASVRGLGVHVANHGSRLQVTMYQSHFRRPASLHLARARAVADALVTGIHEYWNGKDGSEGISIVLTRNAPDAILRGIENYHSRGFRTFDRTPDGEVGFAAFKTWYEAPL